jgi:hypothetical protein
MWLCMYCVQMRGCALYCWCSWLLWRASAAVYAVQGLVWREEWVGATAGGGEGWRSEDASVRACWMCGAAGWGMSAAAHMRC